ncbi:hypothetical protein GDO86_016646 [Hymenochirus boettgeri]|uniref:Ig-like domain-containing protein n=1 Tax=Hymenochirus boettgeri TaxID=247094 RepID=A0A8T2K3S6_9PIPI|nr:hypothetical protein GDO86_016646 [Hymenochirus boettgeri]
MATFQPRFIQEPTDQTVVAGQKVVLSCVVLNYSGIVQWTKDGLALGLGQNRRKGIWPTYQVIGNTESGQYNLEITNASILDDAIFECQATEAALRSQKAKLTVLIPPEDPVIDGGSEILLRAGTPTNLTCRAHSAKPPASIFWYRDGSQQAGDVFSTEVLEDGKRATTVSFLLIVPTDQDIGRIFTCRASNEAAPAGKETSVKLNVHHPPSVTLSIHPQTVLEGERVRFTCSATANPEIKGYRWAKGGVIIESARDSTFETQVDYTFFTEPVSCEVHNEVGSTNVSTLVDVQFAPRIVVEPKPTTTDMGSDVTLTCIWAGNPPLTLTWTKKGSNMVSSSPPRIASDDVQYAVRGDKGKVECFIGSTPPPDRIAWAWKENVLESGTYERYTVERITTNIGVLSTLTINNVIESDFQTRYNCTAWNSFGPGTAIIQLEEREGVPVGIIAGSTIGAGILVIIFFGLFIFLLYRRRKGSRKDVNLRKLDIKVETVNREPLTLHTDREEDTSSVSTATRVMKAIYSSFKDDVDLKQDLRCDTIDREEYELKDPTNGYYNVRAHDDRPNSRTVLYPDYRTTGPTRFDGRPSSRLSHSSGYAQLNSFSRAPASDYSTDPTSTVTPATTDTTSQLSYDNYEKFGTHGFPPNSGYPTFRLGYTQPTTTGMDRGPYDTYDPVGKYTGATRFSYTSQHSDYGQRFQQRMQTHV